MDVAGLLARQCTAGSQRRQDAEDGAAQQAGGPRMSGLRTGSVRVLLRTAGLAAAMAVGGCAAAVAPPGSMIAANAANAVGSAAAWGSPAATAPLAAAVSAGGAGPTATLPADPEALAQAMRTMPVVLLGEVHDNASQHALRAAALARLVAGGARPAIAFEQLDRERQADVDRARRERPRDADWLIAQASGPRSGWDWPLYRPFVQLALDHDLPIVAANLSRADASRVVREGFGAVFDADARARLGLDTLPPALLAAHEREVADGHCGLMPERMLAPMARAQIARDAVLAASIEPFAVRGVVLLTGNGHARRDLGVPRWLSDAARARTLSIGLLERTAEGAPWPDGAFDARVTTAAASRDDPCESLRGRPGPAPTPPPQGR